MIDPYSPYFLERSRTIAVWKQRAKRPIFSALKNEKLLKYGLKMPSWQQALKKYLYEKDYL